MPEETEKNVQKVSQAIFDAFNNHKKDAENPHKVTAQQTGAYTKAETDDAINEKVQQIGAGDMAKAVYDTQGIGKDIYIYSDEKNNELNRKISYLYKATFDKDSWTPGSGNVTQTATLVPVDGGPPVTSGSTLLAYEGIDSSLPQETKDAMSGPAGDIAGASKTLGDNTITVTLDSAPAVDVEIFFSIKQGVEPAVPPLDPVGAGGGLDLIGSSTGKAQSVKHNFTSTKYSGYIFEVSCPQSSNTWTWETFRTRQSISQGNEVAVYVGGQSSSGGYITIPGDKQSANISSFQNYAGGEITDSCTLTIYGVRS